MGSVNKKTEKEKSYFVSSGNIIDGIRKRPLKGFEISNMWFNDIKDCIQKINFIKKHNSFGYGDYAVICKAEDVHIKIVKLILLNK